MNLRWKDSQSIVARQRLLSCPSEKNSMKIVNERSSPEPLVQPRQHGSRRLEAGSRKTSCWLKSACAAAQRP